ncbi:retroviral-like aspartic protease family protein [Sphingomonas sp. H160509]|uniref:retroviral-like aspartic protease family protein n=1 Tax=Sphingomonas sp. H160509 TaxID=2955313 RepID=UPI0020980690|nr:retroviral-like aspartic protease family protein [Sphingomonas sp. H160509]MDD1451677.1 retroviral-like aspartic protease family protein [Sphingomonas sp. H160509]
MRRWLAPLLLVIAAQASAQDAASPRSNAAPPPSAASAIEPDPATLLFGDDQARMTVPVTIAGAGPFAFVVDTGAQRTVIARELAATLGLAPGRIVRVTGMTGSSAIGTVVIPSLKVSVIGSAAIEAPAISAINLGARGLLGIDALQAHAVGIDFDTNTMTVTPSRKRQSRERTSPDEIVIRARSLFGQLVVTDAYCNGIRIRVILDTGTSISMANAALRRKVTRKGLGSAGSAQPVSLTGVTGETVVADYTTIDRVTIGSLTLGDLPVAFTAVDAPPFRLFGLAERPAMLLGMDVLQLFRRVDIDFANREVRLTLPRETRRRGELRR